MNNVVRTILGEEASAMKEIRADSDETEDRSIEGSCHVYVLSENYGVW